MCNCWCNILYNTAKHLHEEKMLLLFSFHSNLVSENAGNRFDKWTSESNKHVCEFTN